jgi:spore coat polysaccharide biosynthesis predicted glycosyltransferase SpsG
MTARLAFRTRGGPTQGWGNVFRLASFASYCRKAGDVRVTFLAEGPPEVARFLEQRGFEVVALADGLSLEEEHAALAARGPFEVVIVEMLDITPARQALLRRHGARLVVFDDLCDHVYDADLVVCGQDLPAHANRALSAQGTRFLVGSEYFLCRPEFRAYGDRVREHAPRLDRVLVTLGGGGYGIGYLKAALALAELEVAQTTFVLGYGDHGDLAHQLRDILPTATVLGGVSDLERLLWACDLVIGGAGYTKLEAALTQTPCLMMSVQWHQIPLAQEFHRRTGTPDLGYMSYVEPAALVEALDAMGPAQVRAEHARRARRVVDGLGFERVWRAVFEDQTAGAQA